MSELKIYVAGYARTPFGKFGGSLTSIELPELGAVAVVGALRRSGIQSSDVDELAFGVNFPGSERSVARQVQLKALIPNDRNSFTVDRACCSSLAAINLASRGLRLGETRYSVAGGVENLSRVPYFIEEARFGRRLGDIVLSDQLVVSCPYSGVARAVQASNEAAEYGIGRQEQDEWALLSQEKYASAKSAGFFAGEIVPVYGSDSSGRSISLECDEPPRPDTSMAALSRLPAVNGSSTVTAGNAPDLSTGATALVLSSVPSSIKETSRSQLEAWSMASGDPQHIASMPAIAGQTAMSKASVSLEDIDVIEINEAFAAVPLVSTLVLASGDKQRAKKIREKTNAKGGAIAIGHPTGATAARLVMTTISQLLERGGGIGLVCICGGVGEAEALVVRVDDDSR